MTIAGFARPHTSAHHPDLTGRTSPPGHSPTPFTSRNIPKTALVTLAKTSLTAIPYRDFRNPKHLGVSSPINIYDSPQAINALT